MNLSDPIYHDADKAREHLEALLWPDGVICPHCQERDRSSKIKGGRAGLYFCNACREQFTVTVGTVFERSKIPLNKWVLATHLMSASKTGISAHQLHRMLGITYKSSWFMCHRIREALKDTDKSAMGGPGGQVQVDETYTGNTSRRAKNYEPGIGKKYIDSTIRVASPRRTDDATSATEKDTSQPMKAESRQQTNRERVGHLKRF